MVIAPTPLIVLKILQPTAKTKNEIAVYVFAVDNSVVMVGESDAFGGASPKFSKLSQVYLSQVNPSQVYYSSLQVNSVLPKSS